MKFFYKASNKDGQVIEGIREANDKLDLSRLLRESDLTLLSADLSKEKPLKRMVSKMLTLGSVSTQEKIIFSRNLSSMLSAGLSLSRALSTLARQSRNKRFKKIIENITDDISKGNSFSLALSKYPKVFSELFVAMVDAGEQSGNLIDSLKVVSDQMEKTNELKKKILSALIYPSVIIVAMIGIGVFMLIYIVPTISKTFDNLDVELPLATRIIIAISDLFIAHYILLSIVILVLIVLFAWVFKTRRGRVVIDFILLHLPLITPLVRQTNSARMSRTLSSLLKSGVSYVNALDITYKVIQNSYFKAVVGEAKKQVEIGQSVSKVFEGHEKLYPIFVSEMIAVGEETGELSEMLMRVATYYEEEVERKTKSMSTIIEPFLMIVVGAGVGFFALSMISPMYQLVENI